MEPAKDAALREAAEETGLVIADAVFLGVTEQILLMIASIGFRCFMSRRRFPASRN